MPWPGGRPPWSCLLTSLDVAPLSRLRATPDLGFVGRVEMLGRGDDGFGSSGLFQPHGHFDHFQIGMTRMAPVFNDDI